MSSVTLSTFLGFHFIYDMRLVNQLQTTSISAVFRCVTFFDECVSDDWFSHVLTSIRKGLTYCLIKTKPHKSFFVFPPWLSHCCLSRYPQTLLPSSSSPYNHPFIDLHCRSSSNYSSIVLKFNRRKLVILLSVTAMTVYILCDRSYFICNLIWKNYGKFDVNYYTVQVSLHSSDDTNDLINQSWCCLSKVKQF